MGETKVSREAVIKAIKGSAGIKSTIAHRLGVSRPTVDNYLKRWATVREVYEAERSRVDDVAVSVVVDDIAKERNVETAKWWLRMKMGDDFAPREKHVVIVDWGEDAENDSANA